MKLTAAIGAVLLFAGPSHVWAQTGAGVAFAPVTGLPIPLESISGRFTSLNPPNRLDCSISTVTGRVVSTHLIMADEAACGQKETGNMLVNVQLANPADAAQMVVGRRVVIKAKFTSGEERRSGPFSAFFLMADNAVLEPTPDPSSLPASAFTSTMLCQPPELDALAARLGSDLCVQSTLVADLPVTGAALEAAARAPAQGMSGDPNAITCRADREHSALHLKAIACARNSYWTWYSEKWSDRSFLSPPPP